MTQKLRIGILSVAHLHADGYIGGLRELPDAEFVGFADEDHPRAEQFARLHNATRYPSYADLLASVDGVVICAENARHLPLIEQAAAAGVGILCEKPLTTSLADAKTAVKLCADANVVLKTAFPMRFNAPALEIYGMVKRGDLGTVLAINGTNQGECPQHHRAWFVDPVLAGGGAITDHTVHIADMLRWMLEREPVEVYAEANHILYREVAPHVETGGIVSLTFDDGTIATIDCSWSKPPYYPTWGGLAMDIIGSGGLATLNAFDQNLTVYRHTQRRGTYGYWGSNADRAMLLDFTAALRGEESRGASGQDGLRAVAVVAAAYESVRTGEAVRVEG
ncbi:MAG: Gfo/Idh/MocA family oxidoreductase [Anaerolinea sp.]|nr:Gfo/Idh/MocA family oxidoreductase [Anaerolinea sp.]